MADNRSRRPYSLIQSFGFAFSGFARALRFERNLRIDITAAAYVVYFSRYYTLTRGEQALVALLIGFVISCELFNTALETSVDLESPGFHLLAKAAKDIAAAAVLIAAAACVVAGYFLFWDTAVLALIGRDIVAAPLPWLLLAAVSTLWIILPGAGVKDKRPQQTK